ncbi:MAG: hypothetical protein KF678_04440 [Phycisphaeraceae bacterium]|nr:hypothetical protein [Phycisphaeraceae bacterium]
MRSVARTLRRVAMVALAVASIAGAAALTWVFVAGTQAGRLSTAHLVAFLALAILPLATLAALILDGKAAREQPRLEDNGLFERPANIEVIDDPAPRGKPSHDSTDDDTHPRQLHQPHHRRQGRRTAGRKA